MSYNTRVARGLRRWRSRQTALTGSNDGRLSIGAAISLLLGSSVLSALITQGFSYRAASRKELLAQRYAGLRVANVLEDYETLLAQNWKADEQKRLIVPGQAAQPWPTSATPTMLPSLLPYASDINWSAMEIDDASDALGFPNLIRRANTRSGGNAGDSIAAQRIHLEMPSLFLRAKATAERIRSHYKLPPRLRLLNLDFSHISAADKKAAAAAIDDQSVLTSG